MSQPRTAWRNLWRNRRRTLITASSIAFGLLLAVTFTGTGSYVYNNMINASARSGYGHITVAPPDYLQHRGLDRRVKASPEVLQQIRALGGVRAAWPHIMGQAMLASAAKSVGGMIMGVGPDEQPRDNLLLDSIQSGSLDADNRRSAVVGTRLAEKLKLKPGRKLVYTLTDVHGEMVSELARVGGMLQTGLDVVDGATVLMPLQSLQQTLGYAADEASFIAVLVEDQHDTPAIKARIAAMLDPAQYQVLDWKQTQTDVAGMITIDSSSNYISQIFVAVLIAAGIFNTMLMSVLERRREFGVVLALGMSPWQLVLTVLVETLMITVLGLLLGALITAPWYAWMHQHGLDFSAMMGNDYHIGKVLIDPVIRIRLDWRNVAAIAAVSFVLTLLAALYPAWRSGRINPAEALSTR